MKFLASTGASIVNQDVIETSVPLVINTQKHVAFSFLSKDRTLSIDRFAERYLDSAAVALANAVDVDGLTMAYQSTSASVGTPGTPPNTLKTYNQAGAMLDKQGVPFDKNRSICISPDMQVEIVDSLKGLFQSSEQIKRQYEKGRMGTAAGFDWIMDQNVRTPQVGPLGGTPAVSATAGQTGSSIATVGWTNAAAVRLKKGDKVSFAGVFAVNPISGDSYAYLKQFTITADTSSDASGNLAMPISPPIIITGPYKTVSAAPGAGALINVFGAAAAGQGALSNSFYTAGLAYHREAFALAMVPLIMPEGVHMSARSVDRETGMSIRMISQYDIKEDVFITRCDIAYGWAAPLPQMSCIVFG